MTRQGNARTRRRRHAAIGTVLGVLVGGLGSTVPAAGPAGAAHVPAGAIESVQLNLLGSSNLASPGLDGQVKPRGQNGDVAVLGQSAFVAAGPIFHGAASSTGRICTDHGGVKVVNLANPAAPSVVSTITMEDTKGVVQAGSTRNGVKFNNVSVTASAVDARTVATPTFSGDVLAVATQRCEPSFFNGARLEFWNVTNRAAPVMLGVFDPANITFTPPGGTPTTGQWGIFEDVKMFVKNGRLMAVATTPFSIGNAHDASPFGDFRLIDLNDIRNPVQVGTFPSVNLGQDSRNGCRTFQAGKAATPTPDGNSAILSWYDGTNLLSTDQTAAVFKLDLNNLPVHIPASVPTRFNPMPSFWGYPQDAVDLEGNAADVQPFIDEAGRLQVLMSEDDQDPARSTVTITPPGGTASEVRACTILAGKHAYEYPGQQVSGPLVYAGRACPASTLPSAPNTVADELLADVNGKIALMEGGGNQFDGCSAAEKAERLRQAGAVAVLQSAGSEVLNTLIAGPRGGIPALPVLTFPQSAASSVQLLSTPVLAGAPANPTTTFPGAWQRTTNSGVTHVAFPGRPDKGRFKSVPSGGGYWTAAADGGVFSFGQAKFLGSLGGIALDRPIVGMTPTASGNGYWLVGADGGLFAFGDATFLGSTGGIPLDKPVVGMTPTPSGKGYWLVASDGGIFAFGDAAFFGSTGGIPLDKPVVGMTPTPSGKGYWLVASDGGIFAFGDATFLGSTGGTPLDKPVVGMAATPSGKGYWLAASDGGIFAFGDAPFLGSTGGIPLESPIVGINSNRDGRGYWLVAADGGIFSFGTSEFSGSVGGIPLGSPMVGMARVGTSDRLASTETATASRFNVTAGTAYQVGAFLQVEAIAGGAFRAAVAWHRADGTVISESQIASLSAVTPRNRFEASVTAPAGAVKGSVKVGWTGGPAAAGTAYADTFSFVRTGLTSTVKDNQGQWGAQRLLNFSATPPTETGTYRSPRSLMWPPPDDGLYGPRQSRTFGTKLAFSTWMSDGLRVLDVSNPAAPREVASFVPPEAADPTPGAGAGAGSGPRGPVWGDRILVTGVDVIPTSATSGIVVISDINAGVYVLSFTAQVAG